MIYFEIKNNLGKVVASNIHLCSSSSKFRDQKNFSNHVKGVGSRGIYEMYEDKTSIWLIVENEKDVLRNSKTLRRTFDFYKEIAVGICKSQQEQIAGTRHVLPNIHTQMIQAIDVFTENDPSVFYGPTFLDTKRNVSALVQNRPADAAYLISYMNKLVLDMGAHLRGVEVMHFGLDYKAEIREVRIRAAILNQYASFSRDFNEAFIDIKVNGVEETAIVSVDKNMFSLIMYNLLSNALKYCMPYSEVRFHFSDQSKSLDISMVSLRIDQDEIRHLFDEGVRGRHALAVAGSGVGLYVIKNALEKMGKAPMRIEPNYQKNQSYDQELYVENHFLFDFS